MASGTPTGNNKDYYMSGRAVALFRGERPDTAGNVDGSAADWKNTGKLDVWNGKRSRLGVEAELSGPDGKPLSVYPGVPFVLGVTDAIESPPRFAPGTPIRVAPPAPGAPVILGNQPPQGSTPKVVYVPAPTEADLNPAAKYGQGIGPFGEMLPLFLLLALQQQQQNQQPQYPQYPQYPPPPYYPYPYQYPPTQPPYSQYPPYGY
jgi:hypothetical protein